MVRTSPLSGAAWIAAVILLISGHGYNLLAVDAHFNRQKKAPENTFPPLSAWVKSISR